MQRANNAVWREEEDEMGWYSRTSSVVLAKYSSLMT